jgi:putative ABC transport system permease protein
MNLIKVSWKNIQHKPLNTGLSLLLLAFGVGIISLLLLVEVQLKNQFDRNIKNIDMVLGAKGSPLQLILSSVYQVDAPTGNINYSEAQRIAKSPFVEKSIPLAYGDNFKSYRIVGTTHDYVDHYDAKLESGSLWSGEFEATIGSKVATAEGLEVGDTFYSAHGLEDTTDVHKDKAFTVVGIFESSGTVVDQLVLTGMESIWGVHESHDHEAGAEHDHQHEEDREITAMFLKVRNKMALFSIPKQLEDSKIQTVLPSVEINRLNEGFGIGMGTLRVIAIAIMVLSFVSVFISLYNSLRERKYELALMRSMGGTRSTLFRLILQEGLLLAILGFVIGIVLSRIGLLILSHYMAENFHYSLNQIGMVSGEFWMLLITIFVGVLASLLPAYRAMKIDIAKTLSNE